MQEELHEFERLKVWELVPPPDKAFFITLKWIYKVKLDELGGILKNKARLVARGYRQEKGINFEESFALLKKALYGLKQAPRVWYDMLSSFLISNDFSKGSVDPTLFIRREGKELLLISQSTRGIFINQSKYALESLKKYGFESCDPVDTPMVEKSKLDEDKEGNAVDPSHYRGMIGTLLYLTTSRPDLQFAICMCARYQARPTEKHLNAVKRIFQYLKGTVHWGLRYTKDSSFALTAFADADHAGCQDTRRSTSGSIQLLGDNLRTFFKICLKSVIKKFEEPALEKEILAFLTSLGQSGEIRKITDKFDFAYLLWEDFIYQIENTNMKKDNAMYYPRFTKLVVNFVMDKDPSILEEKSCTGDYLAKKPPTIPKEKKEKKSGKGKHKAKELETISQAVLTEAEQLKTITKRSRNVGSMIIHTNLNNDVQNQDAGK
ncbi:retrovirus-related pol polyprotein from transposon TNT 1-94 [Tanacetum coccineum]